MFIRFSCFFVWIETVCFLLVLKSVYKIKFSFSVCVGVCVYLCDFFSVVLFVFVCIIVWVNCRKTNFPYIIKLIACHICNLCVCVFKWIFWYVCIWLLLYFFTLSERFRVSLNVFLIELIWEKVWTHMTYLPWFSSQLRDVFAIGCHLTVLKWNENKQKHRLAYLNSNNCF